MIKIPVHIDYTREKPIQFSSSDNSVVINHNKIFNSCIINDYITYSLISEPVASKIYSAKYNKFIEYTRKYINIVVTSIDLKKIIKSESHENKIFNTILKYCLTVTNFDKKKYYITNDFCSYVDSCNKKRYILNWNSVFLKPGDNIMHDEIVYDDEIFNKKNYVYDLKKRRFIPLTQKSNNIISVKPGCIISTNNYFKVFTEIINKNDLVTIVVNENYYGNTLKFLLKNDNYLIVTNAVDSFVSDKKIVMLTTFANYKKSSSVVIFVPFNEKDIIESGDNCNFIVVGKSFDREKLLHSFLDYSSADNGYYKHAIQKYLSYGARKMLRLAIYKRSGEMKSVDAIPRFIKMNEEIQVKMKIPLQLLDGLSVISECYRQWLKYIIPDPDNKYTIVSKKYNDYILEKIDSKIYYYYFLYHCKNINSHVTIFIADKIETKINDLTNFVNVIKSITEIELNVEEYYNKIEQDFTIRKIENNEKECAVCYDDINDFSATTICSHRYCMKCCLESIAFNNKCPICRKVIHFDYFIFDVTSECDTINYLLNTTLTTVILTKYEELKIFFRSNDNIFFDGTKTSVEQLIIIGKNDFHYEVNRFKMVNPRLIIMNILICF